MTRQLIAANQKIFRGLDKYCEARGVTLANANLPRWITSDSKNRYFMIHSVVTESTSFSTSRKVAEISIDNKKYYFTAGFEQENIPEELNEVDLDPAYLTVALSEISPRPKASPDAIRDIVEAYDKNSDPNYNGHDFVSIASLFPSIRIFELSKGIEVPAWNMFFRICVEEADFQYTWIEKNLVGTLRAVSGLDADKIPYKVLCRSIFDMDPSSFFLALYRCLERIYSYSSAKKLMGVLSIGTTWDVVAAALEDQLGWYPREEGSLEKLLHLSASEDLRNFVSSVFPEAVSDENLHSIAARWIYKLRNSIVHYRPAQNSMDLESYDWNAICQSMAGIVVHVYDEVFR